MKWSKLGLIFCADGQNELMIKGGRAPVALHLGDDLFRIYFAAYDLTRRGRIFSLDLDLTDIPLINHITTEPVIDLGDIGYFDDNGIIPSDILNVDGVLYLYTIGFSVKNRIIFDAASGLALSHDNGATFKKLPGPIIDRGVNDPCFAASPTVMRDDDGWRMWYVSCDRWESLSNGGYKHYYNIKHRFSQDGIYWDPHATICIDYANEYEYAISRPSVIKEPNGLYRMWYSFRAQSEVETYRIGYAESLNGLDWTRMDDKVGIEISCEGWDSEMICYPHVFQHNRKKYMLYNGNHYGASGFGLAILEDDA